MARTQVSATSVSSFRCSWPRNAEISGVVPPRSGVLAATSLEVVNGGAILGHGSGDAVLSRAA